MFICQAHIHIKDLSEIVDPRITEYNEVAMKKLVTLAACCTSRSSKRRPSMEKVTHVLMEVRRMMFSSSGEEDEEEFERELMAHLPTPTSDNSFSNISLMSHLDRSSSTIHSSMDRSKSASITIHDSPAPIANRLTIIYQPR